MTGAALLKFLLGNWKWLVPLVLFAGLAIDDGYHRIALANCREARAADERNALQAALDAKERDRARREEIDSNYQAELIRARQEASTREQEIRSAAASTCPVAPARRAYYDGVRREQTQAGGGQARSGPTGGPQPVPR